MKLIDLKLPKKLKKEMMEPIALSEGVNDYPYGLCLSFEKETIEKIKMLQNVKVNANAKIQAEGYVKEVSVFDSVQEKRSRRRVEIQITKLGMTNEAMEDEEAKEAFEEGAED